MSPLAPAIAHSPHSRPNCKAGNWAPTIVPFVPATHSSSASTMAPTHPTFPRESSHGRQVLASLEPCSSSVLTLAQVACLLVPTTSPFNMLPLSLTHSLVCNSIVPAISFSLTCTPLFHLFKSWCCSGICLEVLALQTLHSFPGKLIHCLVCANAP